MDALDLPGFFSRLEADLAGKDFSQSHYSPGANVYLLVLAGQRAAATVNLMRAVSLYAHKARQPGADEAEARREAVKAFEEFLTAGQGP